MQGGTPLHMGYPMCNSHLKTRKENSYAKANFKFYLMCGADMRTFSNDSNGHGYADALTVSEWAVPAMQWANGVGLIQGSDNNLMPKGNATRAQAAAILHRFCETVTGE